MPGTESAANEASTTPSVPMLRIISPHTTPEEVAAIVAVFASLGGGGAPAPKRRPEWNAPHRMVRRQVAPGPGGWRASSLPS
ncbi:hypothetical protein BH09ACT12_BH09ACT12_07930 [soil metagenome]